MTADARSVREFLRNRSGSMTAEFVLMVPILLGALGFAYEFGRALWAYDVMTRDVRAAVRYLSREPYDGTHIAYAQNLTKTGLPTGGTSHFPWGAPWSPTASVAVDTVPAVPITIPTYNSNSFVFYVRGQVPLSLYFLSLVGISTSITLEVTDQARHIGN